MWLHTLIKRGIQKTKSAPGTILWSASALVWAHSTNRIHAYRAGYKNAINASDWFLTRYPEVQKEYREFMRGGSP